MADGQDGSEDPTLKGSEEEFPGVDDGTWRYWLEKNIIMWVAKDPYGFLYTVFLCLTPLFIISAILSYILMKDIDKKEKDKKRKAKRDANMARARVGLQRRQIDAWRKERSGALNINLI